MLERGGFIWCLDSCTTEGCAPYYLKLPTPSHRLPLAQVCASDASYSTHRSRVAVKMTKGQGSWASTTANKAIRVFQPSVSSRTRRRSDFLRRIPSRQGALHLEVGGPTIAAPGPTVWVAGLLWGNFRYTSRKRFQGPGSYHTSGSAERHFCANIGSPGQNGDFPIAHHHVGCPKPHFE